MSANIEKLVRKFVRATFSARVKTVDGEYQTEVSKKQARIVIQNPATVMEVLQELCGAGVEKGNVTTFTAKKGEFKGQPISLKLSDSGNLLTLPMAIVGDIEADADFE